MKCYICGKEIEGYGNNPYPLCNKDDYESRCCDTCNSYVTLARLYEMKGEVKEKLEVEDLVIVFWAKESNMPIDTLKENDKYLAGYVLEEVKKGQYKGTWGDFILNVSTDSYIAINKK